MMYELSKELTPELLGLIYGEDIKNIEYINEGHCYIKYTKFDIELWIQNTMYVGCEIDKKVFGLNIDTLTKLMKEWCWEKSFAIETRFNCPLQQVVIYPAYSDNEIEMEDGFGIGKTEFEVVAKATEWIAIENKLLKHLSLL